jgi:HTH-like domain
VRLPDKSSGVLCSGASVRDKYEFIDAEYAAAAADTATTAPTVSQMCEWLRVSKSGYYEWRGNPGSATSKRREEIKLYITKAFEDSDGTYGYRRVHAQLLRWGVECGDELVRALMRELGLVPCQVQRRRSLTVQAAAGPIPDLVGRHSVRSRSRLALSAALSRARSVSIFACAGRAASSAAWSRPLSSPFARPGPD